MNGIFQEDVYKYPDTEQQNMDSFAWSLHVDELFYEFPQYEYQEKRI